jgi:phage gpG-like protein
LVVICGFENRVARDFAQVLPAASQRQREENQPNDLKFRFNMQGSSLFPVGQTLKTRLT